MERNISVNLTEFARDEGISTALDKISDYTSRVTTFGILPKTSGQR